MHPAPIDRGVHMRALVADCMASAKVGVTPARWLSILCAEALGHKHSAISHVVMEIAAEGGGECGHARISDRMSQYRPKEVSSRFYHRVFPSEGPLTEIGR